MHFLMSPGTNGRFGSLEAFFTINFLVLETEEAPSHYIVFNGLLSLSASNLPPSTTAFAKCTLESFMIHRS
jgi:hypothetical protein